MSRPGASMAPNVFVVLDYYVPGFKSGGPLRTIENTVARIGDRFRFWVFTRDRDAMDSGPYPSVMVDAWNPVGQAMVWYAGPEQRSGASIRQRIAESSADLIYLNSFFSPMSIKALMLRRAGLVPQLPVILAPRGEFSPGALRLKAAKKQLYRRLALALGLYDGLLWQATSEGELADIRREVGPRAEVVLAPNLAAATTGAAPATPPKRPGAARLVFLSRIAEKKNLHYLLELLPRLRGQVELTIYGPVREPAYWQRCQELIARMPASVAVRYGGPVEHEQVPARIAEGHFFALPTLGENFGHALLEGLAAGAPLLVSDQTPWRDLEPRRAGWDLPLESPEAWLAALQRAVDMDEPEYRAWSQGAMALAGAHTAAPEALQANLALFTRAAGGPARPAAAFPSRPSL